MRNSLCLLALVVASASCAEDHKLVETKEAIGVEPTELSFGAIIVGKHLVRRVEVRNLGSRNPVGVTVESVPDGYTVTPGSFTVSPTKSATVEVAFRPPQTRAYGGTVTFRTDSSAASATVTVDGSGVLPSVRIEPLDFGDVEVGDSRTLPLLVVSDSDAPLEVFVTNPSSRAFSAAPDPLELPPRGAGTIEVTFFPAARQTYTQRLEFQICDACEKVAVEVTGRGVQALLAASPSPMGFPEIAPSLSRSQALRLTNVGDLPIDVGSLLVEGEAFSFDPTSLPVRLPVGESAEFDVSFAPLADGDHEGLVQVLDADSARLLDVRLFGTTGGPFLQAEPAYIDFGTRIVGLLPLHAVASIRNVGDPGPIELLDVFVEGDDANSFLVDFDTPLAISPLANIDVSFRPARGGRHSARLVFHTSFAEQPEFIIPVFGVGHVPGRCELDWEWADNRSFTVTYAVGGPYGGGPYYVHTSNYGPNECVIGNFQLGGADSRLFRIGAVVPAAPTLLKVADGGILVYLGLTPDTPIGVPVYANLLYEVNGVPKQLPISGYRDPGCPEGDDLCSGR